MIAKLVVTSENPEDEGMEYSAQETPLNSNPYWPIPLSNGTGLADG